MDCGSFSVCLIDERFECEYIYRDFLLQSTEVRFDPSLFVISLHALFSGGMLLKSKQKSMIRVEFYSISTYLEIDVGSRLGAFSKH